MKLPVLCGVLFIVVALTACTSLTPIRVVAPSDLPGAPAAPPLPDPPMPSTQGQTGFPLQGENRNIIEEYQDYFIGFAEFDDQGWAYSNGQQLDVIKKRIAAEVVDPRNAGRDFLVLVFVHGWHHNAHDNDSNVQEFRKLVDIAASGLEDGIRTKFLKTKRRVIGIYVGWRGESVNAPGFRYLTVFDRRNAAERVAQGAVRQLFANLRVQQLTAQGVFDESCTTPAKMRTVVVGHSFGGLIAFSALAQAELNELTLEKNTTLKACNKNDPPVHGGHLAPLWPDGLILINPAFEATRYESFYELMRARSQGSATAVPPGILAVPHFLVVTSETDRWTGKYFTWGRAVTTSFEDYNRTNPTVTGEERRANLHSLAHVDAYLTHRLALEPPQLEGKPVARLVVPHDNSQSSPVWVVLASDAIVSGHNGFLFGNSNQKDPKPYLANWLLELFDKDCAAAPEMSHCVL